jgi:S1-C subfamily serine protease
MTRSISNAAIAAVLLFSSLVYSQDNPRPYLGFTTTQSAAEYSPNAVLESVTVSVVRPGSPASSAGLLVGDQLAEINGHKIQGGLAGQYLKIMQSLRPGDTVLLKVVRGGEVLELTVVVGEAPSIGA